MKRNLIYFAAAALSALTLKAQNGTAIIPEIADSLVLTESILADFDSMIDTWYAENYLNMDFECLTGSEIPEFPDEVYKERMESLPCVIEMNYNPYVRKAIDFYTVRARKKTSYILGLFPLYEDIFVDALLRYHLPLELKYLPIIESALKGNAVSRVGASGMWQFMFATGRSYGLEVNSLLDDRFDVIKESDAAARYLKKLYERYNDWNLAISAYNCGPGNVNKAIARADGKTSFWEIMPYLPTGTQSYLPSFLAVNYVMSYYREHGICPIESNMTPATDTLHINRNLHYGQISAFCGVTEEELEAYNPQYLKKIVPGSYRTCVLTLPTRYIRPLIEAGDSLYTYQEETFFPKTKVNVLKEEMVTSNSYITHKIKKGESLSGIAAKYHTTVKKIKSWNNLKSDNIIAGRTLKIYK